MKKYVITILIIVGIMLLTFGSYYINSKANSQTDENTLKSKVDEEITYLNSTIISMMNKFNNISYENYKVVEEKVQSKSQQSGSQQQSGQSSEKSQSNASAITNIDINYSSILVNPNKEIDWDYIKKETEKMYGTWTTVLIDLNALNVNKDNLLKFTSTLDNVTQSLENKDKKKSVIKLADLYSLLVSYVQEYSDNDFKNKIYETKSNMLYAYALIEYDNRWTDVRNSITKAKNSYASIINNIEQQNSNNISNINKIYVLLNEIDNSVDKKYKNVFYINYKNFMQEIEKIRI